MGVPLFGGGNELLGYRYLPYSFQGSFFLDNLLKSRENGRFLERMTVENNGKSTPRKLAGAIGRECG